MKKLFILTVCAILTGLAANAQGHGGTGGAPLSFPANMMVVYHDVEHDRQVAAANDAAREAAAIKTAQQFAMEFRLSPEQFQLTKAAIAASDKRWGNNDEPLPLDFDVAAAAKAETQRFHEDLQNIFTHAQYKKYELSKWYDAE